MAACSPAFPPAVFKIQEKENIPIKTASVQSGLGFSGLFCTVSIKKTDRMKAEQFSYRFGSTIKAVSKAGLH
jgi:hypothetical protein